MFDFRHGRTTRRLLSDRKRESWQAAGKKLVYCSNKPCIYYPIPSLGAKNEKKNVGCEAICTCS